MDLLSNFNGMTLVVIMILSYCAVLKSTKRNEQVNTRVFSRKYQ